MRILVVYSHPVPESFVAAIYRLTLETLEARGHEVRGLDLYAAGFEPALSTRERESYHREGVNQRGIEEQIDQLRWAEGLILVYPTWWYALPAMLKGWLDRIWVPGVAFRMPVDGGAIIPLMTHIRLVAGISTYGSPWWLVRWVGDPGRRIVMLGMKPLCARRCRSFWLALHRMDTATPRDRSAFLGRVRRRLERL
jgi:putative NADPH-quinone reductase